MFSFFFFTVWDVGAKYDDMVWLTDVVFQCSFPTHVLLERCCVEKKNKAAVLIYLYESIN